MDEGFMPFRRVIEELMSFAGAIGDETTGVRSYIYECEIDLPVELDITKDENGVLHIGSTPPIYYVDTSIRPSFHKMRFAAQLSEGPDGR